MADSATTAHTEQSSDSSKPESHLSLAMSALALLISIITLLWAKDGLLDRLAARKERKAQKGASKKRRSMIVEDNEKVIAAVDAQDAKWTVEFKRPFLEAIKSGNKVLAKAILQNYAKAFRDKYGPTDFGTFEQKFPWFHLALFANDKGQVSLTDLCRRLRLDAEGADDRRADAVAGIHAIDTEGMMPLALREFDPAYWHIAKFVGENGKVIV